MTDTDLREAVVRMLREKRDHWVEDVADAAIALVVARCAEVARDAWHEACRNETIGADDFIRDAILRLAQEPSHD